MCSIKTLKEEKVNKTLTFSAERGLDLLLFFEELEMLNVLTELFFWGLSNWAFFSNLITRFAFALISKKCIDD